MLIRQTMHVAILIWGTTNTIHQGISINWTELYRPRRVAYDKINLITTIDDIIQHSVWSSVPDCERVCLTKCLPFLGLPTNHARLGQFQHLPYIPNLQSFFAVQISRLLSTNHPRQRRWSRFNKSTICCAIANPFAYKLLLRGKVRFIRRSILIFCLSIVE